MEFFGDEALIFTNIFEGESHILWKSARVNISFNLQGVENKRKSSTETGEWRGGEGGLIIYVKIYAIAHFKFPISVR